jgi:PAS domain S-box-containing protein
MDIMLKGKIDGIQTAEIILREFDIPVIYLTAYSDKKTLDRAKVTMPYGYIVKPFNEKDLYNAIEMALYKNRMEIKLKKSEKKFRLLYENNLSMYFTVDPSGLVLSVNSFGAEQVGHTPDELIGNPVTNVFYEDDKEFVRKQIEECLQNPYSPFTWELRKIKKDGSVIWVQEHARAVENEEGKIVVLIACENITQRKTVEGELKKIKGQLEAKVTERTLQLSNINYQLSKEIEERKRIEDKIKSSLEEKEILLREIHHRVKNNLQIISSLLSLQSNSSNDKNLNKQFRDSQNRIYSMALIHEHLYESENLTKIEFASYIKTLAFTLHETYENRDLNIVMDIDIEDINLGIDVAIPCGLIVNELISNSLQHAFQNTSDKRNSDNKSLISINMFIDKPNDYYVLNYSDNGVGIPENIDVKTTNTLGLQLVYGLTQQLKGNIELTRSEGTNFTICFKDKN